jgi:hypothetical protein
MVVMGESYDKLFLKLSLILFNFQVLNACKLIVKYLFILIRHVLWIR